MDDKASGRYATWNHSPSRSGVLRSRTTLAESQLRQTDPKPYKIFAFLLLHRHDLVNHRRHVCHCGWGCGSCMTSFHRNNLELTRLACHQTSASFCAQTRHHHRPQAGHAFACPAPTFSGFVGAASTGENRDCLVLQRFLPCPP